MKLLEERLSKRQKQGNFRALKPASSDLIDFASNDYLGLARSSLFRKFFIENVHTLSYIGSTGSRLLTGNSQEIEDLEAMIAQFHGFESGVIFNCGYMANCGLFSAIAKEMDTILYDSQVHASTRAGIRLSIASAYPFKHNNLNHLEERLIEYNRKKTRDNLCFICVESIYSTDGSKAPLKQIVELANRYEAHLIVDEAHSVGILGNQGKGLCEELGVSSQVFAMIATFGKALGVQGAIVLGSNILKSLLINFAPSFIYTTAPSSLVIESIRISYSLFPEMDHERELLKQWIQLFSKEIQTQSHSTIQPILIQGNEQVKKAALSMQNRGFDIRPLMSPTVKSHSECLRICLHSFNTFEQLHSLIFHIKELKCEELL